jgi:hypothetical protein
MERPAARPTVIRYIPGKGPARTGPPRPFENRPRPARPPRRRYPGRPPAPAVAHRTVSTTGPDLRPSCGDAPQPHLIDLIQSPPYRGVRGHWPEHLVLVAQHVDVRDRLTTVSDQHGQIDQHSARSCTGHHRLPASTADRALVSPDRSASIRNKFPLPQRRFRLSTRRQTAHHDDHHESPGLDMAVGRRIRPRPRRRQHVPVTLSTSKTGGVATAREQNRMAPSAWSDHESELL